ncbi:MAG: T9SS type A sorting domain-containing protein [Candidatus Eisenbacteria bacterium]|nr:T9SS type A sorting domain-containing protein [Candidatus Eisenbacteria bacterium]
MVGDGAGGAYFAWFDGRHQSTAGTPETVYLQYFTSKGEIGPGWPVNGKPVSPIGTDASMAAGMALAPDGQGGVLIAWTDSRYQPFGNVIVQHIRPDGSHPVGWPDSGVVASCGSVGQDNPVLISDGVGGLLVAWQDERWSFSSDIYAQHIRADGSVAPGWLADGNPIGQAVNYQVAPEMVSDGAGGAIIAWSDNRNTTWHGTNYDIYAQRVTAEGLGLWTNGGVPVCKAPGKQQAVQLCSSGDGGAIAAWIDGRTTSGYNSALYGQHLLPDGSMSPLVPTDGRALCSTPTTRPPFSLAADGAGGSYVSWFIYAGTYTQAALQHVSGNLQPAPGWASAGMLISSVGYVPALAVDGSGGVVPVTEPDWWYRPDIRAYHFAADATPDVLYPPGGLVIAQDFAASSPPLVDRSGSNTWICGWVGAQWPWGPDTPDFLYAQAFPYPLVTATTFGALTVVQAGGLGVRVTWDAYPEGSGRFQLFRAEHSLGPFLPIGAEIDIAGGEHHFSQDDPTALPGHTYYYRVGLRQGMSWTYSSTFKWAGGEQAGFVVLSGNPSRAPMRFALSQAEPSPYRLNVYSVDGKLVRRLSSDGPVLAARIEWDGVGPQGSAVPSGVYFLRLETRSLTTTRRIVLLR